MEPRLIGEKDLNDLCSDFELIKDKSQLLGSRLEQWDLLQRKCTQWTTNKGYS